MRGLLEQLLLVVGLVEVVVAVAAPAASAWMTWGVAGLPAAGGRAEHLLLPVPWLGSGHLRHLAPTWDVVVLPEELCRPANRLYAQPPLRVPPGRHLPLDATW